MERPDLLLLKFAHGFCDACARMRWCVKGMMRRQVATHPTSAFDADVEASENKSLFASFSSEKEDSFFPSIAVRHAPPPTWSLIPSGETSTPD
jgi:hypothetical protein